MRFIEKKRTKVHKFLDGQKNATHVAQNLTKALWEEACRLI